MRQPERASVKRGPQTIEPLALYKTATFQRIELGRGEVATE